MNPARLWTIRILAGLLFSALLIVCWRNAWADLLANSANSGDLDRAAALEPANPQIPMRQASRDLFNGSAGPGRAKEELRRALHYDPRRTEALMDLGLIAETAGDRGEAERLLLQAAALDRTFKPAWTLANFYFRTNRMDRMWPEIRKALEVTTKPQLLFFDVSVIYDLCWGSGADSKTILAVVPDRPQALLTYFVYLVLHNHLDAAREIYARVLPGADPSVQLYRDVFASYCNLLFQARRVGEAVDVWNEIVAKGLTASTTLNPKEAVAIANASFQHPFGPAPFGWFAPDNEHVQRTWAPQSVWFEFDGAQHEQVLLLEKNLPVVRGKDYFLTWTADGSRISRPLDPNESGLSLRFFAGGRPLTATCSAFLGMGKDRGCVFHAPGDEDAVTIRLQDQRPAGSVRLRGSLRISGFQLRFSLEQL